MSKLIIAFLVIIFSFSISSAQTCYELVESDSGLEELYDIPSLNEKACELTSLITTEDFNVYSCDFYPVLIHTVGKAESFSFLFNKAVEIFDATNDSYILLSKEFWEEGEINYRIKIKYPSIATFDTMTNVELDAVEKHVTQVITSSYAESPTISGNAEAELLGLQALIDIINNGMPVNAFEAAGFYKSEFDDGGLYKGASNYVDGDITDYSGVVVGSAGDIPLRDLFSSAIASSMDSYTLILTDNYSTNYEFDEAKELMESGSQKQFIFWFHLEFDNTEVESIYYKAASNLTFEEAEAILIEGAPEEPIALKEGDESISKSMEPDCGPSWEFGKNCLLEYAPDICGSQGVVTSLCEFKFGAVVGLLDGLLSTIHLAYDLVLGKYSNFARIKWVATHLYEFFKGLKYEQAMLVRYINQAKEYVKSIPGKIYDAAMSAKEFLIEFYDTAKKYAAEIVEIGLYYYEHFGAEWLYNEGKEKIIKVMNKLYVALEKHFDAAIANGFQQEGYFLGIILFDILLGYATGGGSLALKLEKAIPILKVLKSSADDFVNLVLSKLDEVKGAASWLKCKILFTGCFAENTPVLVANKNFSINNAKSLALAAAMPVVAVPIQDVQLFDYALAHETVNASYGLTANADEDVYFGMLVKDPYTSDQQRERDQHNLDDENWNEVVFEEMLGASTVKMALHNDWIHQNGYSINSVVNLELPEQGISGPFRITSIKHIIPQKKPVDDDETDEYVFRPITALFTHESNQVYNIDFDNGESLGVTYQHPIYSVSEGDWKMAGELEIGEEVLTRNGNTKVLSSTKKGGSEFVYNLEVKDLHNFLVGDSGFLVHNACAKSILGKNLYDELLAELKSNGLSPREAKEWLEDLVSSGLKDEVLETGEIVTSGLAQTVRTAAREFGEEILSNLVAEIILAGFSGVSEQNSASEVTFDIETPNGTFTTIPDQVVMDDLGNLHLGEAKYSTKDKTWITDYLQASTENQIDFYNSLEDGDIISITPRGPSNKLAAIGLTPGQSFGPDKIKSIHLIGSNKSSKTIKTILRLYLNG